MNTDAMREQAQRMTDTELIHAMTVDKENFSPQFHSIADYELSRRGVSFSDFLDKVRVRHNNGPQQETTIQESLDHLPSALQMWEAWFFTNCLGQTIFIQKEAMWTSVHLVQPEGTPHSCFIESETGLQEIVSKFLNLEPVDGLLENEIRLETWRIIAESDSRDYIQILSGMMADHEIPSTVKSQGFRSCACGGGHLKIMVPEEYEQDARALVKNLDEERNRLYGEASGLPDNAPASEVMQLYRRLAVLSPNDALVHFNYGTALFQLEQWENAADAFTHAAYADPGSLENLRNNLDYLEAISGKLPQNTEILHTRAALSTHLNADPEVIEALYRQAIAADPMDAIAHLNLGYLLYQHDGNDTETANHFQRYLEINPKAEDREQIEEILRQLL